MKDILVILHSYNAYLVMLSGTVAGIWGLIVYFQTRALGGRSTDEGATDATAESASEGAADENKGQKAAGKSLNEVMGRPLRIALIATAVIGLLQGLLGIIMVALGLKPGGGLNLYYLHYVYGAIVVLALPVGISYATGGKNPRRDLLIFSIAALVLAAAAVRAWMTGPVPH